MVRLAGAGKVRGASRFVAGCGVRLHVLEYGADTGTGTLVILPGVTSPAATWESLAEVLARDHRVITWDARGCGLSSHPPEGPDLGRYAADLRALIEGLGLERPALLGHAVGARIALHFAARQRDLVGPVIAVEPPWTDTDAGVAHRHERHARRARAGALTLQELRGAWPCWEEARVREHAEWLPTCDPDAVAGAYARLAGDDPLASWQRIAPPLLLVRGDHGDGLTDAEEERLRDGNPGADIATVPGAGEMLPLDRPEQLVMVVRSFLADRA